MKIRNGFVSNSSSSSFIVIYDNICEETDLFSTDDSKEDICRKIEEEYLDDPNFVFVFFQGTSGECAPMLIEPNDEIKMFIKDKKLFSDNNVFIRLIKSVYILKSKIAPDNVSLDTVYDCTSFLNSLDSQLNSCSIQFSNFDNSSIHKDDPLALEKFVSYLEIRHVFDPDYQRFGFISETEFNTMDEDIQEYYRYLAGEIK